MLIKNTKTKAKRVNSSVDGRIMFSMKISSTKYPPKDKALMAWDENCGLCHYWVIKWTLLTGDRVEYKPYQKVYRDFPDIDLRYFRQAIRFIDTDGRVYGGPGAVFQALHRYGKKWKWVMPLYSNIWPFRAISDYFYTFVSRNRRWIYRINTGLFGKNPARPRPYWAIYLVLLFAIVSASVMLTVI